MPPSFLEQLLTLVEDGQPWRISFSDIAGLARRVPDLALPEEWKIHRCEFCVFAKAGVSRRGCINNKHAANRVLIRRGVGFVGQCHLGLTDMVEPLIVKERVLGAFYYGSVIVRGTEAEAERRIRRYSKRLGIPAEPFLEQMSQVARVDESEIETRRARLRMVAQMAARLAEVWGVPLESDLPRRGGLPWVSSMEFPVMLKRAMGHVQAHYTQPLTLAGVAGTLRISADHLGRLFRQHTEGTLADFLGRVRVNHACRMLESGRYSVSEIAHLVGYSDAAHFGKVFKRLMQCTPGEYASRTVI